MMNPWTLAAAEWRAQRNALRGVALLLGMALAFALTVSWVERGLRDAGARTAARFDLIVGVAGSPTQLVLSTVYLQPQALPLLPPTVWDELARDPGVARLIPLAGGDAVGDYPVVGTSAALFDAARDFALAQGRPFAGLGEAVVGADVVFDPAQPLRLHHGAPGHAEVDDDDHDDAHGEAQGDAHGHDPHHDVALRVVGRLRPTGGPWDRAVLVPVEQLWAVHAHAADAQAPRLAGQVPALAIQPRSVADAYRLRQQWRRGGVMAVFPAEVLAELYGTVGDLRRLMSGFAAATQALVFGAGLLTIAVLLATRRSAYAALRALGAPRAYLFALAWGLGMRVAALACVLALPLAALFSTAARAAVQHRAGLVLAITPQAGDALLPLGLLAACAIGATALAWRACRRPLLDDLRA